MIDTYRNEKFFVWQLDSLSRFIISFQYLGFWSLEENLKK